MELQKVTRQVFSRILFQVLRFWFIFATHKIYSLFSYYDYRQTLTVMDTKEEEGEEVTAAVAVEAVGDEVAVDAVAMAEGPTTEMSRLTFKTRLRFLHCNLWLIVMV